MTAVHSFLLCKLLHSSERSKSIRFLRNANTHLQI